MSAVLLLKALVAIIGTAGVLLAGNLAHSPSQSARPSNPSRQIEFGGVSAQTATRAGTVDTGTAWYTLHADGLHRELSSSR